MDPLVAWIEAQNEIIALDKQCDQICAKWQTVFGNFFEFI